MSLIKSFKSTTNQGHKWGLIRKRSLKMERQKFEANMLSAVHHFKKEIFIVHLVNLQVKLVELSVKIVCMFLSFVPRKNDSTYVLWIAVVVKIGSHGRKKQNCWCLSLKQTLTVRVRAAYNTSQRINSYHSTPTF